MLLELSYSISEDIPVYPGSPKEKFIENTRINSGDQSNTTIITHYIHNGSHVDAPFHFDKDGLPIDQVDINSFVFKNPLVINCLKKKSELIMLSDIKPYEEALYKADILLFNTGYSQLRSNKHAYADDFPALSLESATFIRNELLNVKAIAIDTLSIESALEGPSSGFSVHRMLLHHEVSHERPLVIYEDVDIHKIHDYQVKSIWAFPLRLKGLDGSPVTMVAEV